MIIFASALSSILLQLRRNNVFSISDDARLINVSIQEPINGKIEPISFLSQIHMKIENLVIMNKNSPTNGGSISYLDPGWTSPIIDLKNVTVYDSQSTKSGGVVYVNGSDCLNVNDVEFNKTRGESGGTIGSYFINNVDIVETRFIDSYALGAGGAIEGLSCGMFKVSDCTFFACFCNSTGGAISLRYPDLSLIQADLIVISTMFYNCSANSGGAIYANSNNALNSYFSKICGNNCFVKEQNGAGIFYLTSGNGMNSITSVNMSTFSSQGNHYFGNGNQYIYTTRFENYNINTSNTNAYKVASIIPFYTSGLTCQYCTNANNRVSSDYIIYLCVIKDDSGLVMYLNHINNTVPYSVNECCQIYSQNIYDKRTTIQFSIFQKNNGKLFKSYNGSGQILVYKCYIYHSSINMTHSDPASFEMTSSSNTESQTIPIAHYSTYYCGNYNIVTMEVEPCQSMPPLPTTYDCVISGAEVLQSNSGSIVSLSYIFSSLGFMLFSLT